MSIQKTRFKIQKVTRILGCSTCQHECDFRNRYVQVKPGEMEPLYCACGDILIKDLDLINHCRFCRETVHQVKYRCRRLKEYDGLEGSLRLVGDVLKGVSIQHETYTGPWFLRNLTFLNKYNDAQNS